MILDCFTFFNELDLLEIRLHTLSPYVDKFLISESDHTFQGKPKPFHFANARNRFREFDSKLIWIPVRLGPSTSAWTAWEREAFQRRRIGTEILKLRTNWDLPTDSKQITVLLSDVDEIPDLSPQARVMFRGDSPWTDLIGRGSPVVWVQDMTYYWVDLWATRWQGTVAMRMDEIETRLQGDFQQLRNQRGARGYLVSPGGWHFSFLGGEDAIKTKIEAFSHTEYLGSADSKNIHEAVSERWKQRVDLFGRDIYKFRPLAAEERERLPRYLTDHRAKFSGFFRPDGENQTVTGTVGTDQAQSQS